jgi:hypothetical protein
MLSKHNGLLVVGLQFSVITSPLFKDGHYSCCCRGCIPIPYTQFLFSIRLPLSLSLLRLSAASHTAEEESDHRNSVVRYSIVFIH